MGAMPLPKLIGHLHPVLVHFPIASLLLALLFEWIALARRGPAYGPATRGLVICGVAAGVLTAISGFQLEEEFEFEDEQAVLIERHETAGIVAISAALLSMILGETHRRSPSRRRKIAYLALLHVAAGSVALGASFGGELVWGADWLPL
jgi:uncharacterized membrane protein